MRRSEEVAGEKERRGRDAGEDSLCLHNPGFFSGFLPIPGTDADGRTSLAAPPLAGMSSSSTSEAWSDSDTESNKQEATSVEPQTQAYGSMSRPRHGEKLS